ncbi:Aspartic peptidase domain containing protein [Tylopilus felleus]
MPTDTDRRHIHTPHTSSTGNMKTFTTFSLILLSTSTYALPAALGSFTVPLIRVDGPGAYLKGAANASRARARFLKSRTPVGPSTVSMSSSTPHFIVKVGVGKPVAYHDLVVDTGSSITWFTEYVTKPSTSEPTGQKMSSEYAGGAITFEGNGYRDEVTLAPELVIDNQLIGSVSHSTGTGFNGRGILGLSLSKGRLHPNSNPLIPTVMNNLKFWGLVTKEVFSVYLPPIASPDSKTNGKLTYGGIDTSSYQGDLMYLPLTKKSPASEYWGIELSSCTYGSDTFIPQIPVAGIVDTASPVIFVPNNFFEEYRKAIPDAVFDTDTMLIEIPASSIQYMQTLHLTGKSGDPTHPTHEFTLDVESQLLPEGMNTAWGGDAGKHYGIIVPIGHFSGQGFDFILGIPFLEKYYTVYDADKQRIGFALADHRK